MPKKIEGFHGLHVHIEEAAWRDLQIYCRGGVTNIPASRVINTLVDSYINECVRPRLSRGKSFDLDELENDLDTVNRLALKRLEKQRD